MCYYEIRHEEILVIHGDRYALHCSNYIIWQTLKRYKKNVKYTINI